MKTDLTGIPETLFITLRVRALETKRKDAAIQDFDALRILDQLDFEKSDKDKVSQASHTGTVVRTIIFDSVVADFLKRHPDGVIVNLGCGLDARYRRLSHCGSHWYDLDVEETIEVRKKFFEEDDSYKMISNSMFDYTWMNKVPQDKPTLFLSEGVMMYFKEEDIRSLFNEINSRFKSAEIAFDVVSKWAEKNHKRHPDVKKYKAPFRWGINEIKEIEAWNQNFSMCKEYLYSNYLRKRWPWMIRVLMTIYPPFMKSFRVLHFKLI